MDERKLKVDGKWWLPLNEIERYLGTLTYDDTDGGFLTISGSFRTPIEFYSLQSKEDFILLGESNEGKKITLISYNLTKWNERANISTNEIFSETVFKIKFIILGHHFKLINDILFDTILIQFSDLSKYFRYFDFQRHSKFEPIRISIKDSFQISITYRDSSHENSLKNFFNVNENVFVKFENVPNKRLYDSLEFISTFQDFFNFTLLDTIEILSFTGKPYSSNSDLNEFIEVIWQSPITKKSKPHQLKTITFFTKYKIN